MEKTRRICLGEDQKKLPRRKPKEIPSAKTTQYPLGENHTVGLNPNSSFSQSHVWSGCYEGKTRESAIYLFLKTDLLTSLSTTTSSKRSRRELSIVMVIHMCIFINNLITLFPGLPSHLKQGLVLPVQKNNFRYKHKKIF